MSSEDEKEFPPQQLDRPGEESEMTPEPQDEMRSYEGTGKLSGRVALVTGGDSGIGRAVSVAFAKEGADVAIAYLSEEEDARHTSGLVEGAGKRAITIQVDLSTEDGCREAVERTAAELRCAHGAVREQLHSPRLACGRAGCARGTASLGRCPRL